MSGVGMRKPILVFILLSLSNPCWAKTPVVKLETNFGDIVVELFDANAPITVKNFLGYVKSDFYDGLIFHRVTDNPAVIQGGGFDKNLNSPVPRDPIINESYNGLSNLRGTIAMARTQDPNSATSQFYINWRDNTFLDYVGPNNVGYCVFGQVISDMNVVDRIAHLPTVSELPKPPGPVIIYKARILGDIDEDSDVDFKDYSVLASQWLNSGNSVPRKIIASDGNTGDWLGFAVSVDADYAIVGAPRDNNSTGAAYIFKYNNGNWIQQAKLTASDGAAGDNFGSSVSISANHVIIGAPGDSNYAGSAYIFECNGVNWTQQAKLLAYQGSAGDWFGQSVSISGDCAIVGAWRYDFAATDDGAAFIFYRNQGDTNSWGMQVELIPSDAAANNWFGYSVSINGEYAVIGAIGDDPHSDYPNFTGSAYIYRYDSTSTQLWVQKAKLTASDGAKSDKFGWSVSTDGYYAIVGAILNDEKGSGAGAAYIFEPNKIDPNNWVQKAKLTASDANAGDYFGYSVAIGGGHVLVGAYQNDDNGISSGSVYIFEPQIMLYPNDSNYLPYEWAQKTKLIASDANAGDYFGCSVAIGTGRRAVVGAYGNDDRGSDSGSAYMLKLCPDADLDGDCSVTLNDLVVLLEDWLLH
jgi:cyclophilin family peptidyl-prolyl cis-trans isomerase